MYELDGLCERALANTEFRYLRYAEEVEQFLKGGEKKFCYGAGGLGKKFARYCKKHKLKLDGFVVSDNQKTERFVLGVPVYQLSDVMKEDNIRIVVAVNEGLHIEIANEFFAYKKRNFVVKFIFAISQFMLDDFEEEIEERCKLNLLTDYKKIAADFYNGLITREHGQNASYGHARMMKRLLGLPMNTAFPDLILHGEGWTGHAMINEIDYSNVYGNKIYVAGKQWRNYLAQLLPHKEIIDIGNYIRYEPSLYSESELRGYKKRLGRTLLVFPYHSITYSEISFDMNAFIDEIEKRKKGFDSVLVCMYYCDIQLHKEELFKEKGYTIVTAGHQYDYNFKRRLRSIIELSDVTMSNSLGTHLACCVCLKKPHYLFKQDMSFYCKDIPMQKHEKNMDLDSYCKDYNGRYFLNIPSKEPSETSKIHDVVEKSFSEWTEELTEEQLNLAESIWGDMSPISQ